jgi:hypothetical protein
MMLNVLQSENGRWVARIFLAAAMAGAASAGLSLAGIKGSPVLIGGGWVTENTAAPQASAPIVR